MIAYDPTINLGHLLTFIGFIGGGILAFFALRGQVQMLSVRMLGVEDSMKKMTEIMVTVARQDERQTAMDRRIDDLQHGRGFVLEPPQPLRVGPKQG